MTRLLIFPALKNAIARVAVILPAFALWSCAAPKAVVVKEASPQPKPAPVVAAATPPSLKKGTDGIRLPNMLDLPSESEFSSTRPVTAANNSGAVIARPPTEAATNP